MSTYIPESLRTRISETDRQRCCYCLTSEVNSGIPMTHDHINPRSKGGETTFENLCLSCRSCNEFKADLTEAIDPITSEQFLYLILAFKLGRSILNGVQTARKLLL
jgi:HNH endonuclease